ncbi:glycerol kinase GlpK [Niveibacterium sp. SC-1]|uniref:glycerol kinase GlpK n=1 Tax=Niveibacterium sp. SC-1 TaxID=3135646 RepID=UPI00311FD35C
MSYLLALDQGTTSSRAIVFDEAGCVRAISQREFPQRYPQPGWVEHDPEEIWQSQLGTAQEALARAGLTAADVAALGITNQRETTLVWDRSSGRPICPAIVWQDRRTAHICEGLRDAGHEALFRARTGLVLDPYFSGTKLAWILDVVPHARERAERGELAFGTVDSWLLWRLTGGAHLTDVTNASRTLLFDIHRREWDESILDILRIPRSLLPEVRDSSADYGSTLAAHFGAPIRIGGVAGDQQAALFGQACTEPGMVKNTYGTGCFMLMHTGDRPRASAAGLLSTVAASSRGRAYAQEGSVFVAGAVVQWLRDELRIIQNALEIESLAASVPDSGGLIFVPAFAGLGSPYWDATARGGLLGMTRGSTRAHIARAALDAIAYQSAELLGAMEQDAGMRLTGMRVDGGASVNNLLMQIQADLLGVPVIRPEVAETTALGAAYLAGLSVGVWKDETELARQWRAERVFEPGITRGEAEARMNRWREAVGRIRDWAH